MKLFLFFLIVMSALAVQAQDPCTSVTNISACGTSNTITLNGTGVWANTTGCMYATPGAEKLYTFTPATTGLYRILVTNNVGSGAVSYFFKPTSLGCDDQNWSCFVRTTGTGFYGATMLTAGTQYYILLDRETTNSITHTFQIVCGIAPGPDPCTNVTNISTCNTTVTANITYPSFGWNTTTCGVLGNVGGERLFTFTPATTGIYQINKTGGNANYVDYLYKPTSLGCGPNDWMCVDVIGPNGYFGNLSLTAGTSYYFLLDADDTTNISHTFRIACGLAPAVAPCSNIQPITSCGVSSTISFAGPGYGWAFSGCTGGQTLGDEQIFSYTPTVSGYYSLGISSFSGAGVDFRMKNAVLGCDSLNWLCITTIISNGNFGSFWMSAGQTYYILADAKDGTPTSMSFRLNCPSAIADPCATATQIPGCGITYPITLSGSGSGWSPTSGCGFSLGAERMFTFTPATTGSYTFVLQSVSGGGIDYRIKETSLGCDPYSWNCLGGTNAGLDYYLSYPLTAGVQYYIYADAKTTAASHDSLTILCPGITPSVSPCNSPTTPITCGSNTIFNAAPDSGAWEIPGCGIPTYGREQLYTFTAPNTGNYSFITTNAWDSARYFIKPVSGGCDSLGWTCVGTGHVFTPYTVNAALPLVGGTQYYVLVDAINWWGYTHQEFYINCAPVDPCLSIIPLACNTTATAALASGTVSWGTSLCSTVASGREQLYSFTPSFSGNYEVNVTAASGGGILYGYKAASGGCNPNGFTCIATTSTPGNYGTLALVAGTPYYFIAEAASGATPTHTFRIKLAGTLAYPDSLYCLGAGTELPSLATPAGGTFSAQPVQLRITEIVVDRNATGATSPYPAWVTSTNSDFIEITNFGADTARMVGMRLRWYIGTSPLNYTFNSLAVIPPGQVLVLHLGTGTDNPTQRYFNTQTTSNQMQWTYLTAYSFLLMTPNYLMIDVVTLNSPLILSMGAVKGYDWHSYVLTNGAVRAGVSLLGNDVNTPIGWVAASASVPQTLGSLNPGAGPGVLGGNLAINSLTGEIDLNASQLGVYSIVYSSPVGSCQSSLDTFFVNLHPSFNPDISYPTDTLCINGPITYPVLANNLSGYFSSSPSAGIYVSSENGGINLNVSPQGQYVITMTLNTFCAQPVSDTIYLLDVSLFTYNYSFTTICPNEPHPVVTVNPAGGLFSCTDTNLVLNPATGIVDAAASEPGYYSVLYTVAPGSLCSVSASQTIYVGASSSWFLNYPDSVLCPTSGPVSPTMGTIPTNADDLYYYPAGLYITNDGTIHPANSQAGTYIVSVGFDGTCSYTTSDTIRIASSTAYVFYNDYSFCFPNSTQMPTPTSIQPPGGTFSISPNSFAINPTTGVVDINNLIGSTLYLYYTITYTVSQPCSSSTQVEIMVNTNGPPINYFAYDSLAFCTSTLPNPTPTFNPVVGCNYFMSTPPGLAINTNTGTLNLAQSQPGTYTVGIYNDCYCNYNEVLDTTTVTIVGCAVGRPDASSTTALRIYPNPNAGTEYVIEPSGTGPLRLELLDAVGRVLHSTVIDAVAGVPASVALPPSLPSGTYIVRASLGSQASSSFQLVVVR